MTSSQQECIEEMRWRVSAALAKRSQNLGVDPLPSSETKNGGPHTVLCYTTSRVLSVLASPCSTALWPQIRVIQDRNSYGRIPIAGRLPFSERGWVMAALGARGLIHHAYLGRLLAACALLNTDAHLPPQVMSPLEDLGKDSTGDL